MRAQSAEADLSGLPRALTGTSTQLTLYGDGVFILKNLRPDASGLVTVEGAWSWEDGVVLLVGHLENGARPPVRKHVRYRLDGNLLIRMVDTEEKPKGDVVHAVFRKTFGV